MTDKPQTTPELAKVLIERLSQAPLVCYRECPDVFIDLRYWISEAVAQEEDEHNAKI